MVFYNIENLHPILLLLVLLSTTAFYYCCSTLLQIIPSHMLIDVGSAHCKGKAAEVRGVMISQAMWCARREIAATYFLRGTLLPWLCSQLKKVVTEQNEQYLEGTEDCRAQICLTIKWLVFPIYNLPRFWVSSHFQEACFKTLTTCRLVQYARLSWLPVMALWLSPHRLFVVTHYSFCNAKFFTTNRELSYPSLSCLHFSLGFLTIFSLILSPTSCPKLEELGMGNWNFILSSVELEAGGRWMTQENVKIIAILSKPFSGLPGAKGLKVFFRVRYMFCNGVTLKITVSLYTINVLPLRKLLFLFFFLFP